MGQQDVGMPSVPSEVRDENTGDQPIEVVIDLKEMERHVPNQERWLNNKLRFAGIPVRGLFKFDGVKHGTLTTKLEAAASTFTLCWTPDPLPLDKDEVKE